MSALLEADGLTRHFGGLAAVCEVSLTVEAGEIMGLIGPNGAGKTTFFNLVSGLSRPDSGRVLLAGRDVTGARPETVARLGMARTFQNIRLFSGLSLLENVLVAARSSLRAGFFRSVLGTAASRREERMAAARAEELLSLVGLSGRGGEAASSLAYGDRRLLEIARALALSPKLLLLDEPAAGLNPHEKARLSALIRRIRGEFSLTVLLIEHNVPLVMDLCDRVMVLSFGQRIALGTPEAVRRDPEVVRAYLGDEADVLA